MKIHRLSTPINQDIIADLQVGDKVLISGPIYTARDAAHKRLIQLIDEGKELPFDLDGEIIYYVGPAPAPPGKIIGSAGPTTSYRMDSYTPQLLERGLKGMIGKGQRSDQVKRSIIKNRAVYFVAIGGAAVIMAEAVKSVEIIAWGDLGTEALRKLEVVDLPCFVGIDIKGNDIFEIGKDKYKIIDED